MAAKSMTGLKFVQEHLPQHLQPYAHLIPSVVNSTVGWLDKEGKELALLIGMDALEKAWNRWRSSPDQYTEAQFFGYAKKCIWGAVMDYYKQDIEARQCALADWRQEQEEEPESDTHAEAASRKQPAQATEEEKAPAASDNRRLHSAQRAFAVDLRQVLELAHQFSSQDTASLNHLLRNVPYEDRFNEDDDFRQFDPEYDDDWGDDETVTDEDGEYAYVSTRSAGSSRPLLKLYRLLPINESLALQLRSKRATFEQIGEELGVSRARAQQIWEQAQQRFFANVVRLRQGEDASAIMAEADRLSESARKKSVKMQARKALPFTNRAKRAD